MNSSSTRVLGLALGITAALATVFFLGDRMFWRPYKEAQTRLSALEQDVELKDNDLRNLAIQQSNLGKWNKLSLPKDPGRAAAEYGKMLKPLLRECGLTVEDFQGPPPQDVSGIGSQKKAKHVVLPFQVRAKGTVANLATALEALQRMPVMHRVKTLVADRIDVKDKTGKLNVQMTIEAMIVAGTNNSPKLEGLENLGPATTPRMYNEVALRNPFVGAVPPPPPPPKVIVKEEEPPPPSGPDPREFIRIDTIVPSAKEAFLRNSLYKIPPIRLRSTPMSGYDTFRITDEDRTRVYVKAKVLRIDERDIYFQVGEDVFAFHFGQTMADAMRRPMSIEDMERLELLSLVDAEFAKDDAGKKTGKATKKGR